MHLLSRLSVESRTPGWQAVQDLKLTRIAWQLLRIEVSQKPSDHIPVGSPMKKRYKCLWLYIRVLHLIF
ncbi:hypothetical protein Q1695_015047 [Nippostrongylus brasiliensis]|nr:hypothetical protein Q1695_015047 [Nippostrongylus brasiliensis]